MMRLVRVVICWCLLVGSVTAGLFLAGRTLTRDADDLHLLPTIRAQQFTGAAHEMAINPPGASLLVIRQEMATGDTVVETRPYSGMPERAPLAYAQALARLGEMTYHAGDDGTLAEPVVTLQGETIIANYRTWLPGRGFSAADTNGVQAMLEAWLWVPGARHLQLQGKGNPLTLLGEQGALPPRTRGVHLFGVDPLTGQVGWHPADQVRTPRTLDEALEIVQRREGLAPGSALQSLLPAGATVVKTAMEKGVVTLDLPADFPRADTARLAGLVLTCCQFPEVTGVQFTFGGQAVDQPSMRGNLAAPLTPYQLVLPAPPVSAV